MHKQRCRWIHGAQIRERRAAASVKQYEQDSNFALPPFRFRWESLLPSGWRVQVLCEVGQLCPDNGRPCWVTGSRGSPRAQVQAVERQSVHIIARFFDGRDPALLPVDGGLGFPTTFSTFRGLTTFIFSLLAPFGPERRARGMRQVRDGEADLQESSSCVADDRLSDQCGWPAS